MFQIDQAPYYDAPQCPVHINTALAICQATSTLEVLYRLRVDCRLETNCCRTHSAIEDPKNSTRTFQNLIRVLEIA